MCGIGGFIRLDGKHISSDTDQEILRRMARQMAHRGPDDEQIYTHKNVGLCFRRLAIVDINGGQQPLFNEDRSVVMICNGEIYNHKTLRQSLCPNTRFVSNSDCEIIPHLYDVMGMSFLSQVNGIYAFALVDKKKNKLYLGRDRLGVKPLYYYRNKSTFVFGSEVKTVISHTDVPKIFDWESALTLSARWVYPHQQYGLQSFFKDVHYLPAGHFLEIDLYSGEITTHSYWECSPTVDWQKNVTADTKKFVVSYRELLEDAVSMQLMSDVECGVFLSGGIDSVSVAKLASKHTSIQSFSVLSQSTLGNGDAKSAYAAAKALNIENHMVHFDWRSNNIDPQLWRTILWKCETPVADAEQYYKYILHAFAKRKSANLKVMLLGSGSDEFNGGYSRSFFNSVKDPSWELFESSLVDYERKSLLQLGSFWNKYANMQIEGASLISRDFLASVSNIKPYAHPWYGYVDMYRRVLQMYQLWHEDRTSSANGIEARVPFLDHRLVELTYSVPPQLHKELFWNKNILREAMATELPEEFCNRPKVPFFQGDDIKYTRRLMYNLICSKNYELVHEVIETSPNIEMIINKDVLWKAIHNVPNDPQYSNVDPLLDIINMGLLSVMGQDPSKTPDNWSGELPVSEATIDEWSAWEKINHVSLVKRTNSLENNSIISFVPGIRLMKNVGGDPSLRDRDSYAVFRNNNIEFEIDTRFQQWIDFLTNINGVRSVDQIFDITGATKAEIWKHLEEAIEFNILFVKQQQSDQNFGA
jgi:asparagine synthase (glutamine-hydrolysing)